MNIRLIGGEMLLWSDGFDRPACGESVRELVRRAIPEGSRALLVGPHPEEFVRWLLGRPGSVSVLLRSFPDAEHLATRHEDLLVHCGQPDRLTGVEPFDAVLALDGFGRLHSAESGAFTWREILAQVTRFVAPGGVLLMTTANELGIHRFVEAKPADRDRTDGDWFPPGFDPTHPSGYRELSHELVSAGLNAECCYAGFPNVEAPRALFAVEELDSGHPIPDAVTVALCARGFDNRTILADPTELTRKAFRHGLAGHLAPVWVTVARRGRPPAPDGFPAGIVEDDFCGPALAVVHELVREDDGRWVRSPVTSARPVASGRLRRVPGVLAGPIPWGRVVEEALISGCAHDDVGAVREVVRALADWLVAHSTDGMLPGRMAFATTDNVVWDGERLELIDASWSLDGPVPLRTALLRVLWRFAVRLLRTGHHHPWPWTPEAGHLTEALATLCGHIVEAGDLDRVAALDEEIRTVLGGDPLHVPDVSLTYRELLAVRDGLSDRLVAAQARIDRLEVKLTSRERALRNARRKLKATRRRMSTRRHSVGSRVIRHAVRLLRRDRGCDKGRGKKTVHSPSTLR